MRKFSKLLLLLTIVMFGIVTSASAAGVGKIVVDSPTGIAAGSTAWVMVNITNTYSPQVNGLVFDLYYDPAVVSLYLDAGKLNMTIYYNATVGTDGGWTTLVTQGTIGKLHTTVADNNVPPVPFPNGESKIIRYKFTSLKSDGSVSQLGVFVTDISDTTGATITDPLTINNGTFTTYSTPPPAVTSVNPTVGSIGGGTSVVVTGSGFTGANNVMFGAVPNATGAMVVNNDGQITVTSPAQGAATIDIRVTTPYGTSAIVAGDQFTYAPVPVVTALNITSGSTLGGNGVLITGTSFTGVTGVSFGGTAATNFVFDSATQIRATSPAHAAGLVDIRVTTPIGTSATGAADQFTFVLPPAVTVVSPTVGPIAGTTIVTITGTSFTGATAVNFGAVPATAFTVNSATQITATSPAQGAACIDIRVTTPYGTSAIVVADQFTYALVPAVTSVSPTSGSNAGGTTVIIAGTSFTGATAVSFGGTAAAAFTVNSATQITATSPVHAVGLVDITVTTPIGTSAIVAGDQFTYITGVAVSFTSNYTAGTIAPQGVLFTDTTTGTPDRWNWSFGDTEWFNTSTLAQRNPTHTYAKNGTYAAKLYANNTITSASSNPQTIYIGYAPLASFTSNAIGGKVTLGGAVTFTDTSRNLVNLYTPATFYWVLGDGTSSTAQNPAKTYAAIGTYGVNLTVTDQLGTSTASTQQIVVESVPVVDTNPALPAGVQQNTTSVGYVIGGPGTVNVTGTDINVLNPGAGIAAIIYHTTGVVNTTTTLNGTITGVTVKTTPTTVNIGGYTIPVVLDINAPAYIPGATATIAVSVSDPTNQSSINGAIGGTFNESLLVFDISTTGFGMTSAVINFSIPHAWTARNTKILVVWNHANTFSQLTPSLTGSYIDGGGIPMDTFAVTTSSFSSFSVVGAGAGSSPSPSGGGGGGGASGSGDDYASVAGATGVASGVKTGAMVIAKEGQTLQTFTLITAKDSGVAASVTVPLGTTVRGPDGQVISSVSIEGINAADVPSVPGGATYSFSGLAVKCSPDGATFSKAASIVFSMTPAQWNAALEKANGNTALMTVMFYDTKSASWMAVPTTVNPTAHTVTALTTHFTVFGLFIDQTGTTPVVIGTPTPGEVPTTRAPTVAPVKTTVAPPATTAPGGAMPWTLIIGVIVIIVIVGGAGYYFMTKKKNL